MAENNENASKKSPLTLAHRRPEQFLARLQHQFLTSRRPYRKPRLKPYRGQLAAQAANAPVVTARETIQKVNKSTGQTSKSDLNAIELEKWEFRLRERETDLNDYEMELQRRQQSIEQTESQLQDRLLRLWESEAMISAKEKLVEAERTRILDEKMERNTPEASDALEELRRELAEQEKALEETKRYLREREEFLEESENLLFAKSQEIAEAEAEIEQMREDFEHKGAPA